MSWILIFLLITFLFLFIAYTIESLSGDQRMPPRGIKSNKNMIVSKDSDIAMYRRFLASQFPIELAGESNFQSNIKSIVGSNLNEGRIYIGVAHLELDDYGYLGVFIGGKEVGGVSKSDAKSLLSCVDGEELNKVALLTPILILGGFLTNSGRHAPYGCRLSYGNITVMSLKRG